MAEQTDKDIYSNPVVNKSRYRSLVIFITIFVMVIISVLIINFYISIQLSNDAKEINLAGRQRMLSQSIAKNIHELILAQSEEQDIDEPFERLKNNINLFDKTLNAFLNGGKTIGADNQVLTINPTKIANAKKAVISANKIWFKNKPAIENLVQADITTLKSLKVAIAYARKQNLNILSLMDKLTQSLQRDKYDGIYINLSARQGMLSQSIAKSLLELVNAQSANLDVKTILELLNKDVQAFNETINILLKGGEIQLGNDKIFINPVKNKESFELINKSLELWQPLYKSITDIINGDNSIYSKVATVNKFVNHENLNLLDLMNNLTITLDYDSNRRSNILSYVQIGGIILAIIMFSIIILFFLKHLRQADKKLERAKEETDRILETVNDGLFLLNKEHIIGLQHSKALAKVLNVAKPAGMNFFSILRKIVPENTLKTAKDYLGLLYGDRVNEELVAGLNPLDNVEVYFGQDRINKKVGYLDFEFKRVIKDGNISHLLVQVLDITETVKLEKKLAESKAKAHAQLDLMLEVLHVEPRVLDQFLATTENSLVDINKVLQERTEGEEDYYSKLNKIFRYIHRIKGDAAMLELQGFEQKAHVFEDILERLKLQPNLTGKDFLPLTINLDEFMSQIESLRKLIVRLGELQNSSKNHDGNATSKLAIIDSSNTGLKMSNSLVRLTKSIAIKQNKKVIINIFNEQLLPSQYMKPVQDILTQLIRNSIVHGIEEPVIRLGLNKTYEGLITIKFSHDISKNIIIEYTDDGKGLIQKEIKSVAIEKGLISSEASNKLSKEKTISLIFKHGFSTKKTSDKDAGRGIGMDVIADLVRNMNGKMGIKSAENRFFKFVIKLPFIEFAETENKIAEENQ